MAIRPQPGGALWGAAPRAGEVGDAEEGGVGVEVAVGGEDDGAHVRGGGVGMGRRDAVVRGRRRVV